MFPDWTLRVLLIAALNQYRADRELSEWREEAVTSAGSAWTVPNFRPFSLSALSGGINSEQFHSLNSAFPGQSQAFTEFSPHTLNARTKGPYTYQTPLSSTIYAAAISTDPFQTQP